MRDIGQYAAAKVWRNNATKGQCSFPTESLFEFFYVSFFFFFLILKIAVFDFAYVLNGVPLKTFELVHDDLMVKWKLDD